MFTLVMMTALSGAPDAVEFGGRKTSCTGGGVGLLGGLFNRGGRGASVAADCCGPVAHHSCCDPCHTTHHHLPACGGCGISVPHAPAMGCGGGIGCGVIAPNPVPVPVGQTPGTTAPQQMPAGATPGVTGTPPAPGGTPPAPGGTPGGTF